ncbi:MAG TPA: hypothetical protein VNM69_07735 [Bacillus sp. (in: firmicutes)]|nr:hypothetical protein [Bacillus litorisediminis]HWO75780.1 hypothetical protein [Bacillus sp. (in: firmicutes)]
MSQKREKGYSQKGKTSADTSKNPMAKETLDQAIHPTNRQNSPQ